MLEFLSNLSYWHWAVLGIAFIACESMFPAALLFLWPGIAALLIAVVVMLVPHLDPIYQVGIWLITSLAFTLQWIDYRKANPPKATVRQTPRSQWQDYVGRQFTLHRAIINGRGEIQIEDETFAVYAIDDYPAGTLVKVTRVEGKALRVQQVLL